MVPVCRVIQSSTCIRIEECTSLFKYARFRLGVLCEESQRRKFSRTQGVMPRKRSAVLDLNSSRRSVKLPFLSELALKMSAAGHLLRSSQTNLHTRLFRPINSADVPAKILSSFSARCLSGTWHLVGPTAGCIALDIHTWLLTVSGDIR
jgi:hypothetical protein